MNKAQWLSKAKVLHKTCVENIAAKKGSIKCTNPEAKTMNDLQKAIGSNHAIKEVTYKELRESLDEMFEWVKAGQKDDLLK